jgi:mannitol-1-phosphate/altronate dehydrogenase
MLHIHFGTGRLGLGLVAPALRRSDSSLFLLNRAVSSGSATGGTAVDPARRNALLQESPDRTYVLLTPGGDGQVRERVSYDGFFTYGEEDVAGIIEQILQQTTRASAGVVVTASVLTVEHYSPVVDALNALSAVKERETGAIGDLYLIACENMVSAAEVMRHEGFPRPLSEAAHRHTHCVHALVDRVCVELEERQIEGVPTLAVLAEEYAALKLELGPETEGLATLLEGTHVTFSRHLNIEKDIKGWLLNGSHWLIALTAFQENAGRADLKLNAFLAETSDHHLFAEEIIDEMREGIEALLRSEPQYAGFVQDVDVTEYLNTAAASILARFEANEDTIARILARFRTPTPEAVTTVQQFIGRFLSRIEDPIMAFERKHGVPPKSTSHSLFNLFRLQASGMYVDSNRSEAQ